MPNRFEKLSIRFILVNALMFMCALQLSACARVGSTLEGKISSTINQLTSHNLKTVRNSVIELHLMGKESIPYLIELIDRDDFLRIPIGNPEISFQHIEDRNAYVGELASLVVDLILGKTKLDIEDTRYSTDFLFDRQENILYGTSSGLIYKKSFFGDSGIPIKGSQLKKVKKIYEKWWETNKGKNLSELRRDWKNDRRPLSNTEFFR